MNQIRKVSFDELGCGFARTFARALEVERQIGSDNRVRLFARFPERIAAVFRAEYATKEVYPICPIRDMLRLGGGTK